MADTAVWFDLDGTLCHYERSFDRMVSDALVAAGVRNPPDSAYDAFAERVFTALEECESEPYRRAFEHLATVLDLDVDPDEAAEAYREIELEATSVSDAARDTVAAAADRGPVGLLTNGDGDLERGKLEHHDLDEQLDAVVISNEVGVRKPDPAIFETAADHFDVERHVYVADEFETDVQPAADAGWETVHVRNDEGPSISVNEVGALRSLFR